MPEDESKLTCEEFQGKMAELVSSGADIKDLYHDPHAKTCAICRRLLREIETLA